MKGRRDNAFRERLREQRRKDQALNPRPPRAFEDLHHFCRTCGQMVTDDADLRLVDYFFYHAGCAPREAAGAA